MINPTAVKLRNRTPCFPKYSFITSVKIKTTGHNNTPAVKSRETVSPSRLHLKSENPSVSSNANIFTPMNSASKALVINIAPSIKKSILDLFLNIIVSNLFNRLILINKHLFQNMKFKLILTTCVAFFLFLSISYAQDNPKKEIENLEFFKIILNNGSYLSGQLIEMNGNELSLKVDNDTILFSMENIKSINKISALNKSNSKKAGLDMKKEQLYYYANNGFDVKSTLYKSNLLLQNELLLKISNRLSFEISTIVYERGTELSGLFQINYGQSKLIHPYVSFGGGSRIGFSDDNFLDIRHGVTIGNAEAFLNLEIGGNYSIDRRSFIGINYEFGFFYKVGNNVYVFMEHRQSARGLIKYYNSSGVQFKFKALNGQLGIQNIYTKNNLLDFNNAKGSLFGPMVRLMKPLGGR